MRTAPGTPSRPRGDVMRTDSGTGPTLAGVGAVTRMAATAAMAAIAPMPGLPGVLIGSRVDDWCLSFVDEVAGAGRFEQLTTEATRFAKVFGQRENLVDQVSRLAAAKGNLAWFVVGLEQVEHQGTVERDLPVTAAVLEDLRELGDGWAFRKHLVVDASKECCGDEVRGFDIGCEDDQYHEWEFEFLPRLQGQEVDSTFKRNDPPVEQIARRDLLPAEVVDDQHAAVGDGLDRSSIETGVRTVTEFERFKRQLAPDHYHRSPAQNPALIQSSPEIELRRICITI